jgi:carbonic anhydrase/acetyltransferase-like protein (isoleucine patch superfamily)
MGAIILPDVVIEEQAMIGAGSLLTPGTRIPARTLAVGSPATVRKQLSGESLRVVTVSAKSYHDLKDRYLAEEPRSAVPE